MNSEKARPLLVRVATGTKERRLGSSIWRIWQGSNTTDDIYIAVRQLGGVVKCSLHANRYCYMGFTKPYAQRMEQEGRYVPPRRAWTNWQRPDTPTDGFQIAAEIMLPAGPLYDDPKQLTKET